MFASLLYRCVATFLNSTGWLRNIRFTMVVSLHYDPNGKSHQTEIVAVMWSMTVVAMGFVIARLGVRQRILKYVGVDDWLIAASMVSSPLLILRRLE